MVWHSRPELLHNEQVKYLNTFYGYHGQKNENRRVFVNLPKVPNRNCFLVQSTHNVKNNLAIGILLVEIIVIV